jgi:hypothetical protein
LKRFSPGERFRKLDASVDFPLTDLDLSAYTSPGIKPSPCSYQLYGVINHSGSAYSGHYTASCRHPFSANWHEYNDSRFRRVILNSKIFKKLTNSIEIFQDIELDRPAGRFIRGLPIVLRIGVDGSPFIVIYYARERERRKRKKE